MIGDSSGASFGYDQAGNLTSAPGWTYGYDGANRLATAAGPGGTSGYGYDGDGARVKQAAGGGEAVYYVRSSVVGQAVLEVGATQGVRRAYLQAGGKQLAERAPDGRIYWLHTNHLNSASRMTDQNGAMVYRGEYDPYGNEVYEWGSAGLNTRKFTGYERDATGLDYANARMYGPGRGRFMQPDPIGIGGANRANPQSLNRYSYVQNDPVNFSDPTGNLLAAPDGPGFDSPCQSGIGTLGGALTGVTMTLAREAGTGWSIVLVWGGLGCVASSGGSSSSGAKQIGERVPLQGEKLRRHAAAVNKIINELLKLGNQCESYLVSKLGPDFNGLSLSTSLLQQQPFDGNLSTIDIGAAGIWRVPYAGVRVNDLLNEGSAVTAVYATGKPPYPSNKDVYYTSTAISVEVILHETLHHHSKRLSDDELYNMLNVERGSGTIAISEKLAKEGCR